MLSTMMKRRDLTWITDTNGEVVSVGVVMIDETAQRIEPEHESSTGVPDGMQLHLPPGVRPLVAG